MRPEELFLGAHEGWGVAQDPFGKILRRFRLTMVGAWSADHKALYLDETYAYVDGASYARHWVITTDERGRILGSDAREAARLRGRDDAEHGFSVVFDRSGGPDARYFEPVHRVRFVRVAEGEAVMVGRIWRWCAPIALTFAALRRV